MLNSDINKIFLHNADGGIELLCNIKFVVDQKKIYTILGKNGSGKSTLLKSITGLLDSEHFKIDGKVLWFDKNIFEMKKERLLSLRKTEIKYVLQDLTKNFNPLKTLKYYFDNSGINTKNISLQLKNFLLPDYESISQLHSYEISGGMAQRLSLMLAILSKPKLLILDEPTSAIDYANINLIKLKLMDFKQEGGSALIVTQDISFAKEISDEIALLHNKTLTEFTESAGFFKGSGLLAHNSFLQSYKDLQ